MAAGFAAKRVCEIRRLFDCDSAIDLYRCKRFLSIHAKIIFVQGGGELRDRTVDDLGRDRDVPPVSWKTRF
jgi:hypothetical protein